MKVIKPEILAPCGNKEALYAAVAAGADACYLAGNSFGARAFARNFSSDELIAAIEYAHLHGVKIYLTANTLLKDDEFTYLYDELVPLYEHGLDAVLVQDFGVLRMIRKCFPGLPIHTSTQMNITGINGMFLAEKMGAERVVAAREMSLKEMRYIKENSKLELEAFVHGAMCFCYSGRCLMSSMAGGRSGNRGKCAQPCRMRYDGSYKFSMKDMCTIQYIPELIEAGIDSLKIEGRMKNEYYVAAVTDAYKQMVEDYMQGCFSKAKASKMEKRLLDTFNRGGFTSGYLMLDKTFHSRKDKLIDESMPGRRGVHAGRIKGVKNGKISFKADVDIYKGDEFMVDITQPISITSGKDFEKGSFVEMSAPETRRIKPGTDIYRTRCLKLQNELRVLIDSGDKIGLKGHMNICCGEKTELKLSCKLDETVKDEITITVTGDVADTAKSRPISDEDIKDKILRTGEEDFVIEELIINNDNNSFLPVSSLKKLRRQGLNYMKEKIVSSYYRNPSDINSFRSFYNMVPKDRVCSEKNQGNGIETHISVSTPEQLDYMLDIDSDRFDYIYLDMGLGRLDTKNTRERIDKINTSKIIIALPYINRGDYSIKDYNELLLKTDGLYIRNIDDLAEFIKEDIKTDILILASSLYAYNSYAVQEMLELLKDFKGLIYFETPVELDHNSVDAICFPENVKVVQDVYNRIPLMVTDAYHTGDYEFTDDKSNTYSVIWAGHLCYNVVLGKKPLSLHQFIDDISCRKYGFSDESVEEMKDVLSDNPLYISKGNFTKGHYERGI